MDFFNFTAAKLRNKNGLRNLTSFFLLYILLIMAFVNNCKYVRDLLTSRKFITEYGGKFTTRTA